MVEIFFLTALGAIGAFAFKIFKGNKLKKKVQNLAVQSDHIVAQIDGFSASSACTIVNGIDLSGFLYVDQESRKFCIVSTNMSYKIFEPKDILDVSIVENNPLFTETKITTQIGRALLGGKGAGNKTNDVVVNTLYVVMHVNDPEHHTIMINCLPVKTHRNSPEYQNAIYIANSWQDALNALLHSS